MNTFGRLFRVTTFGESHGPALGAVVDGCPARIPLAEADIQPLLDRRRPGTGPLVSPRPEADRVAILSGVFEGVTTGAPIALVVGNEHARSSDYDALRDVYRPGHADITYTAKYGVRDHRGGGRSSGRETIGRVAAGAVALKVLSLRGIGVAGRVIEVHGVAGDDAMAAEIRAAAARGDSVGGIVEVVATGVPAGLGDPVFGKLDAAIAGALMGIGAVKGVEIGTGFAAAARFGSKNERSDPARRVRLEPRGRHPRGHLDRRPGRRPVRGQADAVDRAPPADGRHRGPAGRDPGRWPARPLHRAPARPGGRGHARARARGRPARAGGVRIGGR